MLSRVDGKTSVGDIADSTGFMLEQVQQVFAKVEEHDVLEWIDPPESARPPRPEGSGPSSRPEGRRPLATPSRGIVRTKPLPPGASRVLYDPSELEEPDVDLDLERRRRILDAFYRVDELDHYETLGIPETSDKKEIRTAYFTLSKVFHPDTLYGKRLGGYKQKMERVFKALTEAYEVLGKKRRRAEYDAYLKLRKRSKAMQEILDAGQEQAEQLEREVSGVVDRAVVMPEAEPERHSEPEPLHALVTGPEAKGKPEPEAKAEPAPEVKSEPAPEPEAKPASERVRRGANRPPAPRRGMSTRTAKQPARPATEPPAPRRPVTAPPAERPRRVRSAQERRKRQEHMARRLAAATGRTIPQKRRPLVAKPPISSHPPDRQALIKGLASSLKQVAAMTGGIDRVERHLADAAQAEAAGDLLGAANALRLAHSLAPERHDVKTDADRVQRQLLVSMAETYEQQANYEEKHEKWSAAAASWGRVADGLRDRAEPARRAATALVFANGDLKKARDYAQRAVELAPDDIECRIALGRVYVAAGMQLNARRELDVAAKLDSKSEIVKNLLRELKG